MLSLGPISDEVRKVVQRLVAEAGEPPYGYMLSGGPSGAFYIDADGEVSNCYTGFDDTEDTVLHVPDGPMKVSALAVAAERVPELAAWLPARPLDTVDCDACGGTGSIMAKKLQCPKCIGMGWVTHEWDKWDGRLRF